MDTSGQPVVYTSSSDFFRQRHTSVSAFTVAILLFFLPFAEIKCSSNTLAENTGIGLATGRAWKTTGFGQTNEFIGGSSNGNKKVMESGPSIYALLALIAAVVGLLISLFNLKSRSLIGISAGILGILMLLIVMIQYKRIVNSSLVKNAGINIQTDLGGAIRVQFTVWYYLCLGAFASAAFFSYKHYRIEMEDEVNKMVGFEFEGKEGGV